MRMLFIYPNLNAEEGFNHGIADLSGCLKARGHVTGLINLNEALYDVPSDDQVVEQVKRMYDLVGGFDHLLMMQQAGFLDHKSTVKSMTLFAKEVYPQIRDLPGTAAIIAKQAAE